jgi:serine/threonine protein kinase
LDAVIGRGGMGTVYRATDQALEKTVSLKVIAPHLADDDTFVQRFREEAKALARLDGDGIVDVYTMRETEKALFFVMEHIDGPSLQTVLQRRGVLEPSQALSLLRQVLEAVRHAHESGVLHRDLKPSNILLDDGQALITDFGLAKILASDAELTKTHDRLGTVAYMSPEQVEGLQNVGEASDLFSVGLIAYEVLTGRLPFDRSESEFVIQRAIVEESFPPPSAYAPDVPPAVESVVLDLLAKDPADRSSDAHSVLQRLPASTEDGPILEEAPASSPEPTLSAVQWMGLGATTLLVLAGVYVGVRGSLGLPMLSLSAPSPPDTTQETNIAAVPSDQADGSGAPQREQRSAPAALDSASSTQGPSTEERPSASSAETDSEPPRAKRSSASSAAASPSPGDTASTAPFPPATNDLAPEPTVGHLAIRSQPRGAAVRVNDSLVGRTPLVLDSLTPAAYQVALRRSDYRPLQQTVEVSPNDTTAFAPSLTARPAVVRLQVRPSGTVRIDGQTRPTDASGTAVDSVSPGSHRVVLVSNLGRWETQLQLDAGERYTRTVDFTQRVEAAVTARTPSGTPVPNATVTIDETQVGFTPQRLTRRVGQHTIRVDKEGYVPAERTVLFDPDMETPIVAELTSRSQ